MFFAFWRELPHSLYVVQAKCVVYKIKLKYICLIYFHIERPRRRFG